MAMTITITSEMEVEELVQQLDSEEAEQLFGQICTSISAARMIEALQRNCTKEELVEIVEALADKD